MACERRVGQASWRCTNRGNMLTKVVLLHKASSPYDDRLDQYYHFPNRAYLKPMVEAVGDWVIFHEPLSGNGRQVYFAAARVVSVVPDARLPDHSYAHLDEYVQFPAPVGLWKNDGHLFESGLEKSDGSINGGTRQRAVRRIDDRDFAAIWLAAMEGADAALQEESELSGLAEEQMPYERPVVQQLVNRKLRDSAFRIAVLGAYDSACAFTDLKIINGRQRAEVDAAHIRPVGDNHRGNDSVRNGLALSKTVHWLFDRGIVAVSNDYEILESPGRMPDQLKPLLRSDGMIRLPDRTQDRPSPVHLAYHRAMFEEEYGRFQILS